MRAFLISRLPYFLITLLIGGVIMWGALNTVPPIPKIHPQQDKLEHFLAFGALTLWLTAFLRPSRVLWAAFISTIMAIALEVAQSSLTETRSGSLADLLASLLGIVACVLFVETVKRKLLHRHRSVQPA